MTVEAARPSTEVDTAFEQLPVLSQIENDRFCDGSVQPRMQGVRRDPRLSILVVRCPECSRFHPVAIGGTRWQLWLQRTAPADGCLPARAREPRSGRRSGEAAITGATLDELDNRHWYGSGGRTPPLYERRDDPEYAILMGLSTAGSLAAAFAGVGMATLLFHHWRRWGYFVYTIIMHLVGRADCCRHISGSGWIRAVRVSLIAWLTGMQIVGGILAVRTTRPLARLVTHLLVPPGLRVHAAFLWSADGLEPPITPAAHAAVRPS